MEKLSNLDKILKEIDNIEQLGADMRYKVNNDILDIETELISVVEWAKSIRRRVKKELKNESNREN